MLNIILDMANNNSNWGENLEPGDKCLATIRHKTDGSKNRHNVEIIVIDNFQSLSYITAWDRKKKRKFKIPYNELSSNEI